MNEFFIVTSGGLYGSFGRGTTLEAARQAWRKAGGRKVHGNYREQRFTSDLPFCPIGRKEAREDEADAWIGGDGSTNWLRCKREVLTK